MVALFCHPTTPAGAVRGLTVDVQFGAADSSGADAPLALTYSLDADIEQLSIPERRSALSADGLWARTCFELFVMQRNGGAYREFNFSPSTEWAAYDFDQYRSGMTPVATVDAPPAIVVKSAREHLELSVRFPASLLSVRGAPGPARIAVAAVLEERHGKLSYWALAHPNAARPDFHHPESFVHEIWH